MRRQGTPNDEPLRGPRPLIATYADLFASCLDCGDLADGYDNRCSKCASDREFAQQLAAKAAARSMGE